MGAHGVRYWDYNRAPTLVWDPCPFGSPDHIDRSSYGCPPLFTDLGLMCGQRSETVAPQQFVRLYHGITLRGSKFPIFEDSGTKIHTLRGLWRSLNYWVLGPSGTQSSKPSRNELPGSQKYVKQGPFVLVSRCFGASFLCTFDALAGCSKACNLSKSESFPLEGLTTQRVQVP